MVNLFVNQAYCILAWTTLKSFSTNGVNFVMVCDLRTFWRLWNRAVLMGGGGGGGEYPFLILKSTFEFVCIEVAYRRSKKRRLHRCRLPRVRAAAFALYALRLSGILCTNLHWFAKGGDVLHRCLLDKWSNKETINKLLRLVCLIVIT